ncbi:hypothetical protein GCM10027425_28110 [Alteromonas gracilis]
MTLDVLGYWWLPRYETHRVPGRLVWDPERGGDLDLLGELIPFELKDNVLADGRVQKYREHRTRLQNQFPIIHGKVGNQAFTLLNSFSLNGVGLYGLEEGPELVATNGVLVGAWYSEQEGIEADRAIFHMRHLTSWVDIDSITTKYPHLEGDIEGPHIVITAHQAETLTTSFGDTEIRIWNALDPTGDRTTHSGVNHAWRLTVRTDEPSRLDKLTDVAIDLRALVTIGTGKTADIEKTVLQHPQLVRHTLAGTEIPGSRDDITYYSRWSHRSADLTPVEAHNMYFSLAELGGPSVIASWLTTAAKYSTELRRVMATRYTDSMYLEDQIANVCASLESFDETRRKVPKDEASFKERVRASMDHAGEEYLSLIVEPLEDWLTTVVRARNHLAHHGSDFRLNGSVGERLMAEQLFWLFAFNLLREAGAADSAFASVIKHRDLRWLIEQAE